MQLTLNLLVVLRVLSSGLPEPPAMQNMFSKYILVPHDMYLTADQSLQEG